MGSTYVGYRCCLSNFSGVGYTRGSSQWRRECSNLPLGASVVAQVGRVVSASSRVDALLKGSSGPSPDEYDGIEA